MKEFDDWCARAVAKIRYRPDREEVHAELMAHLEDHYDALLEEGYDQEEAKRLALKAMGSPEAIAPQLGAIHRPWMGNLITATNWLLIFSLILVAIHIFTFVKQYLGPSYTPEWFYENPGQPMVRVWEDSTGETRRVLDLTPNTQDFSDGFRFILTRAVLLEGDYYEETEEFQDYHILFCQVEVSSLPHWRQLRQIPHHEIYALDSLGNTYTYSLRSTTPSISGNMFRTGPFTYTMDLCLNNYCSEDAQWIEIRYDRDGRDMVLRMDLTGGDGT